MASDRAQMGPSPKEPVVLGVLFLIGASIYSNIGVEAAVTYVIVTMVLVLAWAMRGMGLRPV